MATRHKLDDSKFESVLIRLEELVRANSGEDAFEEVFKILLVKIFTEKNESILNNSDGQEFYESFNKTLSLVKKTWPNIVEDRDFKSTLEPSHLMTCYSEIMDVSLLDSNFESLDMFFEYLVSKTSKGAKGQYFTPRHVIECCVRIISPKNTDLIADPACGSGGFLFHSLGFMNKSTTLSQKNVWGFDFDSRAIQVAKTLVSLCGGSSENLYNINSLIKPSANMKLLDFDDEQPSVTIEDVMRARVKKFSGFDVILTNPPFAGEIKEESILNTFQLAKKGRKNERDVLFIERCVDLLKPGGKIAIVLPHNKVGAKGFSYLRDWMLKRLKIVSVLSLPRPTFLPHTHQKAEVIFAVKRDKQIVPPDNEKILFLIAEKDAKDSKGQLLLKRDIDNASCNWDKVDHDLDDVVNNFQDFVIQNKIEW